MSPGVEVVSSAIAQVGEGAVWCMRSARLLWIDAWAKKGLLYHPDSGQMEHWDLPRRTGCVASRSGPRVTAVSFAM